MKKLAAIAIVLFSFSAWAAEPAPAPCTTVIAVRHAEQTDQSQDDPPLSAAGAARAQALASVVSKSGVKTIYVTQFKRTKDTAAPTAENLNARVIEVPVDRAKIADYAPQLVKRILADNRGGVVLVVGHSNTIPAIVEALTNVKVTAIEHDQFDRLFIATAGSPSCNHVVEAQYGH